VHPILFLYAIDFRAPRPHGSGPSDRIRGFTAPSHFARVLDRVYQYKQAQIVRQVAAYERDHRDATFKLLGELTGLSPRDLNDEVAREGMRRQQGRVVAISSIAAVMAVMLALVFFFYNQSEKERIKAERSLQMIGDAHQSATRLLADVLVGLRAKLARTAAGPVEEAEQTVRDYFEENEPSEVDEESTHMRSVVLNSRGYLARKNGAFAAAEGYYGEAMRLRKRLLDQDPQKPMYLHNVAATLDAQGDLYRERYLVDADAGKETPELLTKAMECYLDSLDRSKSLSERQDTTTQWKHDYAVSCFKVGDVYFRDGDLEKGLEILQQGLAVAKTLAAADPDYPKYQAHLALFHLEIGQLEAMRGNDEEAKRHLHEAERIFAALDQKKKLIKQYAAWRAKVAEVLMDLGEGEAESVATPAADGAR